PRLGQELLLRHLSEAEATDAVHPDEFRQRFAAAASVSDPHLVAVREVLEIADRPAVLQELLAGVPSADWPALAAAPGAGYRLLGRGARGVRAAPRAGAVHGHLPATPVLLPAEGVVRRAGLGNPGGRPALPIIEPPVDPAADLFALGRIAAG